MPKRSKPRALDTGVIAAINAAAPKLASTDPAVYVAFLMFSRLGSAQHRNKERSVELD